MTKTRVICPECGHRHTLPAPRRRVTTVGVRARRQSVNNFQYTVTLPPQESDDDGPPILTSPLSDILLVGALAGSAGALTGYVAILAYPPFSPHAVVIGFLGGAVVGYRGLIDEHKIRLRRTLPNFLARLPDWQRATQPSDADGVTLTVDHRYRDSYSEAGRTVNYFGALPVDIERFNEYARAAVRGDSLAIAQWVGAGNPFSRNEYDALLAMLRRAECVVNVPGKGNRLTTAGLRAFKNHLKGAAL